MKAGRDPAIYPYDTTAELEAQVDQSIASFLKSLGITYIDCLLLHSPYPTDAQNLRAWRAFEQHVPTTVRALGLSNIDAASVRALWADARVKPSSVQNRFTVDVAARPRADHPPGIHYPDDPYDREVRALCSEKGIVYTPWGVLWGSDELLAMESLKSIAGRMGITKEVAFYVCALSLQGPTFKILCGTKRPERMSETVDGVRKAKEWIDASAENESVWKEYVSSVQKIIDPE